ncbi:MAG: hypothetical protein HY646_01655 [Acidobacteria bacterium]|nr:hypothetical protein [Acidobacteriota bacterium]
MIARVRILSLLLLLNVFPMPSAAQHAELRKVPRRVLPVRTDGNSPAFWHDGKLKLFSSIGVPQMISQARDQFGPWQSAVVEGSLRERSPIWVESAWMDSDGILFAWYHHEPAGLCGDDSPLTVPEIGAAISFDGGKTLEDLGIILKSGEPVNCDAANGYFAGGHGDFAVVPDRDHRFFYFIFSNYGGAADEQGITLARMAFEDRFGPAGAVWKFRDGSWNEPGLGGRVTALYRAQRMWEFEDADSVWGPSVHWNTYLEKYVLLMNHACCEAGWFQEGIYISYVSDLADPSTWGTPTKLIDGENIGFRAGFYPQVLGLEEGETDSVSGWFARLYIQGISMWEIIFSR